MSYNENDLPDPDGCPECGELLGSGPSWCASCDAYVAERDDAREPDPEEIADGRDCPEVPGW